MFPTPRGPVLSPVVRLSFTLVSPTPTWGPVSPHVVRTFIFAAMIPVDLSVHFSVWSECAFYG